MTDTVGFVIYIRTFRHLLPPPPPKIDIDAFSDASMNLNRITPRLTPVVIPLEPQITWNLLVALQLVS